MIKEFQPPFSPGKEWRGRESEREQERKGGGRETAVSILAACIKANLLQVVHLTKLFLSSGAYVFIAAIGVRHVCCCIDAVPLSDQRSVGISDNQDD